MPLLLVAACGALLSCAGKNGAGSGRSSPLARFAWSEPVWDTDARATASMCASREECGRACMKGGASACARFADWIYPSSPAQAREFWTTACQRRDGLACARLMALEASHPELADRLAEHACAYGQEKLCQTQGALSLMRALAGDEARRPAGLQRAARLFQHNCSLGHWRGCLLVALLLERAEFAARKSAAPGFLAQAYQHAAVACDLEKPDVDACGYRAQYLERRGDLDAAKASYAKGCTARLRSLFQVHYEQGIEHPVCQRAQGLGVLPSRSVMRSRAPGAQLTTSTETMDAQRIAGNRDIHPPNRVKRLSPHMNLQVSAKLCIARSGLVSAVRLLKSSGVASYDARILQQVRGWRYRPFQVDGVPSPVCSSVLFVYAQ